MPGTSWRTHRKSHDHPEENLARPFFTTLKWNVASSKRVVQLLMGLWGMIASISRSQKMRKVAHRGGALLADEVSECRSGVELHNILCWEGGSVEIDRG